MPVTRIAFGPVTILPAKTVPWRYLAWRIVGVNKTTAPTVLILPLGGDGLLLLRDNTPPLQLQRFLTIALQLPFSCRLPLRSLFKILLILP